MAAIARKFLGGRNAKAESLTRERSSGFMVERVFELSLDGTPRLSSYLRVRNETGIPIEYLNPGGHAVIDQKGFGRRFECTTVNSSTQPPWHTCDLHGSLPNATGFCLPSTTIENGRTFESTLDLEWTDDEAALPSSTVRGAPALRDTTPADR